MLNKGLQLAIKLIKTRLFGDTVQRLMVALIALIFPDMDCHALAAMSRV